MEISGTTFFCGHLFAGRYKALAVDGSGNGYLLSVCDYVHLNPVRAKCIKAKEPMEAFAWSSYGEYLKLPGQRLPWLRTDRLLGERHIPKDSPAGRRQFARQMEERRGWETQADYRQIRRGWCLGDEEFRRELLPTGMPAGGEPIWGRQAGARPRESQSVA